MISQRKPRRRNFFTERAIIAEKRTTMSSVVPSLDRAFKVDQAINYATKDYVIVRFGDKTNGDCQKIDEWIENGAKAVNPSADMYMVEKKDVPELVARFGLSGPCSIIFFYQGSVVRRLPTYKIKQEIKENKSFLEVAKGIMKIK